MNIVERPIDADRLSWRAFDTDPAFRNDWWDRSRPPIGDPFYVSLALNGVEVARAEILRRPSLVFWPWRSADPRAVWGIELLEVATGRRCQGVGVWALNELEERFSDQQLVAFSVNADSFWEKAGWTRVEAFETTGPSYPLFVSAFHAR